MKNILLWKCVDKNEYEKKNLKAQLSNRGLIKIWVDFDMIGVCHFKLIDST